jgi:hypothetical protein
VPSASAHLGRFVWDGPYAGSFEPDGPIERLGSDRVLAPPVRAARLVVASGALDELLEVVREVRARQIPDADDPLVAAQGGAFRHREAGGEYRNDAGAQIILIDTDGSPRAQFEADMVEIAEAVARWFGQRIVMLDLQENGITQVVHAVSP